MRVQEPEDFETERTKTACKERGAWGLENGTACEERPEDLRIGQQ